MSLGPDPETVSGEELLRLGAGIVAAYVSRNSVSAGRKDIPAVCLDRIAQ